MARTVALVGGWERLCSGEASYAEGLSKQIKAVYARQAEQWVERAAPALCLPEAEGWTYFPRWQPWEVEVEWRELRSLPSVRSQPLVPCPPELRGRLAGMGVIV